tara:strand:- start:3259 stop:3921 length:663 start_codon:yes stop_codon:yes gene_type:complete
MKLKIDVPDSLSEITLSQYQKFEKIDNDENRNTNFILHKLVEIFCNLDLKDIIKIKWSSVSKIANSINELFEKDHKLIRTFSLNGVEYGFIPNLDDMTLGEYIDLDNSVSDWQEMHKAMAVLFRPVTYKKGDMYLIKDYQAEEVDELKHMPLDVVLGSLFFFYNLRKELLNTIPSYLKLEMQKKGMTIMEKLPSQKSGDGINLSMDWLREMFSKSYQLQN